MKKRKNGEGTIYRRPCGLWVGEITLGYSEGKRIRKSYASRDIAKLQRALNHGKYIIDNADNIRDCPYTVGEWIPLWLDTYKRPVLKPSTLERYYYSFDCNIIPRIGGLNCGEITPDMVQTLYNDLHVKGFSESSIKKVHFILRPAMEYAVRKGYINKNPCADAVIPKTVKRVTVALTVSEQTEFENALPSSVYGDLLRFALYTGLRVGEITALTWTDVDFGRKLINVNKTVYNVKDRKTGQRKITVSTPKTPKSSRVVPLNTRMVELLRVRHAITYKDTQKSPHNAFFEGSDGNYGDITNEMVFTSKDGTLLDYHNIRRAYMSVLKRGRLKKEFTIHSLRHTFATRLLEKGVNIKTVSELLGHASVQITLDVYGHISQDMKHSAVALLVD